MDITTPFGFILFLLFVFIGFYFSIYLILEIKYFFIGFKKAGDFSGRSNRKEFWIFVIYNNLLILLFEYLYNFQDENPLVFIYLLIIILPSISLFIRRMHDIDKKGWFILIPIWNLIFATYKGTKGKNRFGNESIN